MTADRTTRGTLYSWWCNTALWAESRRTEEFVFFLVIMKSVTADGSLRSPTGGVEELHPAPHIHEQMTTSYYSYDTAYTFTQNNITLEHNAMNNKNTITHMDAHNTQYRAHCAPPIDAYCSHRTCGSSPPCTRHPIHACAPVCCVVVDFSSTVSVLYFVPPLSFQPFQMFTSVFNEKFRSNSLCDFRLGTVATSDHETPLTRSKAKAKPQQRELFETPSIIPMHDRKWIDIEPSEQTLAAYDLSMKVISFLRHNQTLHREEDGAIEFCKIKFQLL